MELEEVILEKIGEKGAFFHDISRHCREQGFSSQEVVAELEAFKERGKLNSFLLRNDGDFGCMRWIRYYKKTEEVDV